MGVAGPGPALNPLVRTRAPVEGGHGRAPDFAAVLGESEAAEVGRGASGQARLRASSS
jgi:hypothetical protein